jgi:cobalamin synthase
MRHDQVIARDPKLQTTTSQVLPWWLVVLALVCIAVEAYAVSSGAPWLGIAAMAVFLVVPAFWWRRVRRDLEGD